MTWNGMPPMVISRPDVGGAEAQVGRPSSRPGPPRAGRRRRWRRSGTCPARPRRRGPWGRPRSCRRSSWSCSWCRPRRAGSWTTCGATAATPASLPIASASSSVSVAASTLRRRSGSIGQQVRAEAREAVRDVRGGALADADERDDRGDADDDAEHRQGRPEPARAQARERQSERARGGSCHDPPVAQVDLAGGGAATSRVVGDEDDRPARGVELVEERHDLGAGRGCRGCRSARRRG